MSEQKRRAGAGRKPNNPPCRGRHVYLTDEQVRLLRTWGRGDVSAALRWLIDIAATIIHRPEPPEEQSDLLP